jgi:DMSO/TMAO reductase YedYZ molybdopterin-dependent catalytic subunit
LVFALSAPSIFFGQQATPATENDAAVVELRVTGSVSTPLALSMADLKKMPRKTLKVVNPHEKKAEVYEGVPIQDLLRRAGVPMLRSLTVVKVPN